MDWRIVGRKKIAQTLINGERKRERVGRVWQLGGGNIGGETTDEPLGNRFLIACGIGNVNSEMWLLIHFPDGLAFGNVQFVGFGKLDFVTQCIYYKENIFFSKDLF